MGRLYYLAYLEGRLDAWGEKGSGLEIVLEYLKKVTEPGLIDPGKMVGRGGARKTLIDPVPEEASSPDIIRKTAAAYQIVDAVEGALTGWPALVAIKQRIEQYDDLGWDGPSQYLTGLVEQTKLGWLGSGQKKDFVTGFDRILHSYAELSSLFRLDEPEPRQDDEFRGQFLGFVAGYLGNRADLDEGDDFVSLRGRIRELLDLEQYVSQCSGVIVSIQNELDQIHEQFGSDEAVEVFAQQLSRSRSSLRTPLSLTGEGVQIEQVTRGVVAVQKRLSGLMTQVKDFLLTPPTVSDPRLAWNSSSRIDAIPQISRIRDKVNELRTYNDDHTASTIEDSLRTYTKQIGELLKLDWVRLNQRKIESNVSDLSLALDQTNQQIDQRIGELTRPQPGTDPRQASADRARDLMSQIDQLSRFDEALASAHKSEFDAVNNTLTESFRRHPWIAAYSDQAQRVASTVAGQLDELEQRVFERLDPRLYWQWQSLTGMIEQELSQPSNGAMDPSDARKLQSRFASLRNEINKLTDAQLVWSPDTREDIEQRQRTLQDQLDEIAGRVISDQRNLFEKKWIRLAGQIDAVLAFRGELADASASKFENQYQQIKAQKQQLFAQPWPDDPQERSTIRASVRDLDQKLDQFYSQLDPRAVWKPIAQSRVADIRTGITELQARGDTQVGSFRQQIQALATGLTASLQPTWNPQNHQRILNEIRAKRQSIELLYQSVYSKLDPRLQVRWDWALGEIDSEIRWLEGNDKTTARALAPQVESAKAEVADLLRQPWDQQSKSGIEQQVAQLQSSLRTIYATAVSSPPRVEGVSSPVVNEVWRKRRQELIASPLALIELQDAVSALRTELRRQTDSLSGTVPGRSHPRGWSMDLAVKAVAAKREQTLLDAFGPWLRGQINWSVASDASRWKNLQQDYQAWRDQVAAIMDDFRVIEQALDNAYDLAYVPQGYKESLGRLHEQWRGRKLFVQFSESLGPVVRMIETMAAIKRSDDPAALRRWVEESKANLEPAITFAAWRKLDKVPGSNWPSGIEQLQKENELRQWLGAMIRDSIEDPAQKQILTDRLRAEGHQRWARCFAGLREPENIERAVRLSAQFDVDASRLPTWARFNIDLAKFKQRLAGLPHNTTKDQVRSAVDQFQRNLPSDMASQQDVTDLLGQITQVLNKEQSDQDTDVDLSKTGPEASPVWDEPSWKKEVSEDRSRITYAWTTRSGDRHELQFVRVEANYEVSKSFYISTTETSLGLIKDAISFVGKWDELKSVVGDPSWHGPKVWKWRKGRLRTNDYRKKPIWMPADTRLKSGGGQIEDYFSQDDGQPYTPAGPDEPFPMQFISPEGAIYFARTMGCRLPSSAEWRAALAVETNGSPLKQYVDQQHPNLRDSTWLQQNKHVQDLQSQGVRIELPNSGGFWESDTHDEVYPYDDGVLWFDQITPEKVAPGNVFHHMIGNVAEYVFERTDALEALDISALGGGDVLAQIRAVIQPNDMGVIGGSAQSPPGVLSDLEKPAAVSIESDIKAYADVGMRLVFSAPRQSLVGQVRRLLDAHGYLATSNSSSQ